MCSLKLAMMTTTMTMMLSCRSALFLYTRRRRWRQRYSANHLSHPAPTCSSCQAATTARGTRRQSTPVIAGARGELPTNDVFFPRLHSLSFDQLHHMTKMSPCFCHCHLIYSCMHTELHARVASECANTGRLQPHANSLPL